MKKHEKFADFLRQQPQPKIECAEDMSAFHSSPPPLRLYVKEFLENAQPPAGMGRNKAEQAAVDMLDVFDREHKAYYIEGDKPRRLWLDWRDVVASSQSSQKGFVTQDQMTIAIQTASIALQMLRQKGAQWLMHNVTFVNISPFVRSIFNNCLQKCNPNTQLKDALVYGLGDNGSSSSDGVPF